MTARRRAPQQLVVSLTLVAITALGVALPAFAADADSGTPLTVSITDESTAAPSSSATAGPGSGASPSGGARGSSGSTGIGSTVSTGSTGSGSSPAGQTTPANEVAVGGGLYVGGLNGSGTPSVNPADGTVEVWFTVRNSSRTAVDATAKFWMDGAIFSNRLDAVDDVSIAALQPGEARVVSASLHGAGQWTLVSAHFTFTPPETVDGAAATAVTRDGLVLVFPWLLVLGAVSVVLAFVIVRVVRSALPPVPAAALS